MKIDYVVFGSDQNETYLDFYKPVAKVWKERIGLNSIFFEICDDDSLPHIFNIEQNEFGFHIKVKSKKGIATGLQSQLVRLFSCQLFQNANLLISDVDMFPISKSYFIDKASPIADDEILLYTGTPYGNVPYFPMCYILGNGKVLFDMVLEGKHLSYYEYLDELVGKYNAVWHTDEWFFYDQYIKYEKKNDVIIGSRNFNIEKRLDRGTQFDVTQDLSGFVDSHSIRPYSKYKDKLDYLVERLINEKKYNYLVKKEFI